MEAEERPVKLRKLENDSEKFCVSNASGAHLNGAGERRSGSCAEDVQHGSMNALAGRMRSPDRNKKQDHHDYPLSTEHIADASATGSAYVPASNVQLLDVDVSKPLSKNQQKKLKRQQEWEAGREEWKAKRKEKTKQRKERKRAEKQADIANGIAPAVPKVKKSQAATQLPITFIFDCDFDDLMSEKEMVSLASQLTRCYSDNKNARLRAHLAVSSFRGKLKERFNGALHKHYESWKGVRFFSEDFVEVAEQARDWMRAGDGGEVAGMLRRNPDNEGGVGSEDAGPGEVIYLSSDSDVTLSELKPYSTYIIGGLVDRNRHKGICHRRALERGVKTAKLPIGQFLEMNSRAVLATNHVYEIMLKWLECGDWGDAFMHVIPKRKGGVLRDGAESNKGEDASAAEPDTVPVDGLDQDVSPGEERLEDQGCQS